MATIFLSNAKAFLPSFSSTSSSPSSSALNHCIRTQQIVCKAENEPSMNRRTLISINLIAATTLVFGSGFNGANAAILEADEDDELMERIKNDRKKRIEKQGVIKSSAKETAYIQDLVYKLSKVGQAIEKNDLPEASSLLGPSKETEWVEKVNSALNKLSSSSEEKTAVDSFSSSLYTLISSVSQNNVEASKLAFVESASAFEKWTTLSGLVSQLKGL